jgi:hypothetical protein
MYNSANNAAAYYKPLCNGYITTTATTYIGVIYTGAGNGANIANGLLNIDVLGPTVTATAKQFFIATNSATLVTLASNAYLTFPLGIFYSGSSVSQFSTSVHKLNSGYSYKISFTCDIYSGLTALGAFTIARSTTSTLPASISNWNTQTLGNSYNSASNAAANFKPVCNGYITTTVDTYIGIFYTGSGNGANVANGLLTIDVL